MTFRGWLDEIESDQELRRHIERATAGAVRRGLADGQSTTPDGSVGPRRSVMVRATRPAHAVEPKLAPGAILLADNVTTTKVLAEHAERIGVAW
ncbi:hypothetical protein [Micromonospora sp. NPDC050695]|uniref:hypothetical protein n=1 Tax=Micromonospora sp. NPDC050695 TaxID=3154938 RepID=UPI00340BEB35